MKKNNIASLICIVLVLVFFFTALLSMLIPAVNEWMISSLSSIEWRVVIISFCISTVITIVIVYFSIRSKVWVKIGKHLDRITMAGLVVICVTFMLWWLFLSNAQNNFTVLIVPAFLSGVCIHISKMRTKKDDDEKNIRDEKRKRKHEEMQVKRELYVKMIDACSKNSYHSETSEEMVALNGMVYVYCERKISDKWKALQEDRQKCSREEIKHETLIEMLKKDLEKLNESL